MTCSFFQRLLQTDENATTAVSCSFRVLATSSVHCRVNFPRPARNSLGEDGQDAVACNEHLAQRNLRTANEPCGLVEHRMVVDVWILEPQAMSTGIVGTNRQVGVERQLPSFDRIRIGHRIADDGNGHTTSDDIAHAGRLLGARGGNRRRRNERRQRVGCDDSWESASLANPREGRLPPPWRSDRFSTSIHEVLEVPFGVCMPCATFTIVRPFNSSQGVVPVNFLEWCACNAAGSASFPP